MNTGEEIIALLFAEPFEHGRAEALGAALASLHYAEPEALGRTQEVLAHQLFEGLTADQVAALQPRLASLFSGLATGFLQQVRETTLIEQERIRGALIAELQRAQQASQKAYAEVEQQVQERTAELRVANKSLQHEITERKQTEEEIKRRNRELAALNAIANATSRYLHLEEVLDVSVEKVKDIVGANTGCVLLIEGSSRRLRVWGRQGLSPQLVQRFEAITPGEDYWQEGAPLDVTNLWRSSDSVKGIARDAGLASCILLPLRWENTALGIMLLTGCGDNALVQWSMEFLMTVSDQLSMAVRNAQLYEEAQRELAERKRAEKALRESEERYRGLFEGVPVGLYRITPDGHFLDVNSAMLKMLDYPDKESLLAVLSVDLQVNVTPDNRQWRQAMLERTGTLRDLEVQLRRHDGSVIWARTTFRVVRDADDQVLYYEGSVEDITERKRAEEALRKAHDELEVRVRERTVELAKANEALLAEITERKQAEEELIRLSSAVKTSVDSIVIIDVEGKIIDVNEAALKMYGTDDKGDLIGQNSLDLLAPKHREKGLAGIEFVLEKGYDTSRDYEVISKNGSRVPVGLSAAVMKDAGGKPTGIVIIARDITERKRVEKELRESEATMRALLNATIEAATLVDTNGILLAANETAARRLGKSVDALVGLCVYDFFPPDLAKFRKAQADKVFRSGAPVRFEDERGGRSFDNSLYPILDARGKAARIAVYARDITHRKQAEKRIRTYQERLRSLASQLSLTEERERRDIATTLHDRVGQTLAICKIKLGPLRKSASSTDLAEPLEEIHQYIEDIIRNTRSLTFELSSPILYQLGLEAAMEWLTEQAWERDGIPSKFREDGQPKPLDDDMRVLLFQAVRELLVNVAKHAQAQSVEVAMQRDGNNVQIIVEDDGVGFDAFPIGSHWSEIKGFGLFSIRERLDHLGGQLKIVSKPGHGTRVTLVAPLKREEKTTKGEMT